MTNALEARPFATVDESVLRTRSRADFVYDSLRDAISEGRITKGERVREEEIARNLGVSRTPVREALQRLQQRGLLVFGPGRGLAVAELNQQQVIELYAMREILEGSAARFAAKHATDPEIAMLYRLQQELKGAKDAALVVAINRRFHRAIYEAAHNRYLMQTLEHLVDSFALLHSATFRMPRSRAQDSDEEHRKIVAAIEKRDPDLAEKAARDHIVQAQRTRFENVAANAAKSVSQGFR
jgi:DNA-binding GntR family transcriptional regulator